MSTETAGVDHIGIVGADGDVAALTTSHRVPISRRDGRVIGPTGNAQGIDVLLGTIDPVGDLIVGRHVIELSGRLVVLRGPGGARVEADACTPVIAFDDPSRVARIDPQVVLVLERGRERLEQPAAVR